LRQRLSTVRSFSLGGLSGKGERRLDPDAQQYLLPQQHRLQFRDRHRARRAALGRCKRCRNAGGLAGEPALRDLAQARWN
jgi:hypothetical protein